MTCLLKKPVLYLRLFSIQSQPFCLPRNSLALTGSNGISPVNADRVYNTSTLSKSCINILWKHFCKTAL